MAKLYIGLCVFIQCLALYFLAAPASADPSVSTNYKLDETSLGGSGLLNGQSANFQGTATTGILGLGSSAAASYLLNAGHVTTSEPALAFAVNTANVSFGTFSAGSTAVATSTFEVLNYTSYGYVVQTLGTPPTYGTHTIPAMASSGPSQAGVEQFGINLVANTSPVSLGANPDQGQFGFGIASASYDTPNNYRFVSGETIAQAPKSSGVTVYTISYIVNVSSLTPGGQYSGAQTILCTGTY